MWKISPFSSTFPTPKTHSSKNQKKAFYLVIDTTFLRLHLSNLLELG